MSKSCSSLAFSGAPDLHDTALHRSAYSLSVPTGGPAPDDSFLPPEKTTKPGRQAGQICSQIAGILAIIIGAAVLIGWWLNFGPLKCIIPGAAPLKPNVGAGLLLAGAALVLLSSKRRTRPTVLLGETVSSRFSRRLAALLSAVIVALGLLTLAEYFLNLNFGIDQWLMTSIPRNGLLAPGRMNPVTALGFVLTGTALLLATQRITSRWRVPLIAGLGASAALIGLLPLAGFCLEGVFGRQWNFLGMSLSGIVGAASFLLIGSGLLALVQSQGALKWSLGKATTIAFAAGVLLSSLTTAAAFNFAAQMLQANGRAIQRHELLRELQACKSDIADLLNSQRGYVILGDDRLLTGRIEAKSTLAKSVETIRGLTKTNPGQQQRVDRLAMLIKQRLDWEERVITERRTHDLTGAARMIGLGTGMRLTDEIETGLKNMETEENRLLIGDRKGVETAAIATFLLLPFGVFLTLGVLTLAFFFLNSGMTEQLQSETALRDSRAQLRTIVESLDEGIIVSDLNGNLLHWNPAALKVHGYAGKDQDRRRFPDLADTFELSTLEGSVITVDEWPLARILHGERLSDLDLCVHRIGTDWRRIFSYGGTLVDDASGQPFMAIVTIDDITERKRAEQEIAEWNTELEKRVTARTAEMQAANNELEAFSYSVSHDLRAPLRAVDGFSQAMLEDYGSQLPGEGRHYLETIRHGAQRMGALIDDLLTFSRLSRLPLSKQPINTTKLVEDIVGELRSHHRERKVEVRLDNLAQSNGDPALLKQVWINLISNAFKYTSKRENPVIEIGSTAENGEIVYFVSDNGVGFDMQYAHKLFGVFQRLHRAEEFDGTGVGLAIVQRIAHRHGGRAWAKAEPDHGASFYFTLGKEEQI